MTIEEHAAEYAWNQYWRNLRRLIDERRSRDKSFGNVIFLSGRRSTTYRASIRPWPLKKKPLEKKTGAV